MHHIKPTIQMPTGKERQGRGFSPNEIKQAGLNRTQARKLKIPVDYKRKTSHEKNIAALKAHNKENKA